MTEPYDVDHAPDELEIRCPRCRSAATFTFARAAFVESKKRRAELAKLSAIELEIVVHEGNNRRTLALYYPRLGDADLAGMSARRFRFGGPKRRARELSCRGTCRCGACSYAAKHSLAWPRDAVFACAVRGQILWAWTRRHAAALRDYLAARVRRRDDFPRFRFFLMHVPAPFLTKKNRDEAVRKLARLLSK